MHFSVLASSFLTYSRAPDSNGAKSDAHACMTIFQLTSYETKCLYATFVTKNLAQWEPKIEIGYVAKQYN